VVKLVLQSCLDFFCLFSCLCHRLFSILRESSGLLVALHHGILQLLLLLSRQRSLLCLGQPLRFLQLFSFGCTCLTIGGLVCLRAGVSCIPFVIFLKQAFYLDLLLLQGRYALLLLVLYPLVLLLEFQLFLRLCLISTILEESLQLGTLLGTLPLQLFVHLGLCCLIFIQHLRKILRLLGFLELVLEFAELVVLLLFQIVLQGLLLGRMVLLILLAFVLILFVVPLKRLLFGCSTLILLLFDLSIDSIEIFLEPVSLSSTSL